MCPFIMIGLMVMVARSDLIDSEVKLDTVCDIVATKVELYQQHPLVIISVYRATNNGITLRSYVKPSVTLHPSFLQLHFGLAAILTCQTLSGQTNPSVGISLRSISECFLSTFHDLGLTQIVDFPTRLQRTLDLFVTNRPTFISKCVPLPGVSDQEMVLTAAEVSAKCQKPVHRKIHLWKKADLPSMKTHLSDFATNFSASNTIATPVDDLWIKLTSSLDEIMEACVSSKFTTTRFNQPWISGRLKRLARRKNRAYRKTKHSSS